MTAKRFEPDHLYEIAVDALCAHNTKRPNARLVADALIAAESDGLKGHGLSRLPSYCSQAASGKVNGNAEPRASMVADAAVRIDADNGFAYPALALARERLRQITPVTGIALAAVAHSHHCGAAGYHVEALARQGLIGLLFANTPKAIAPWGGDKGVFGTNPIAFATPRPNNEPLVIDLSLSKVARGKIMVAQQRGDAIPEGWALDSKGHPTTDPDAAMTGTMLPLGEAKGACLVLMVEILAAALTGSSFGFEASSFFSADGNPPNVGQLLIALDPGPLAGASYGRRLETLMEAILSQKNTRLPGDRRLMLRKQAAQGGIYLSGPQYAQLVSLGSSGRETPEIESGIEKA